MGAMDELVQAGKVRVVGCSNFSVQQMREASRHFPLQVQQLPYNLLSRSVEEELLPACQTEGVSVIAYWALCKGLLAGKYTEDSIFGTDDWRHYDPLFQSDTFNQNLRIVGRLEQIAADEGITTAQLAIAWVCHQPGVTSTIVGARRPEQAEQNARAGEVTLGPETLTRIEEALED